jgi:hypothetical protein
MVRLQKRICIFMMMFCLVWISFALVLGQAEHIPQAEVSRIVTFGGELFDTAYDVVSLPDGNLLVAGIGDNPHLSHRVVPGQARVTRLDPEGNVLWAKDYGEGLDSHFASIVQVADEEFVLVGEIDVPRAPNEGDIFLVKIDASGTEIWRRVFEREGGNHVSKVRQTSDGGLVILGSQVDRFMTGGGFQSDLLLIRTDEDGNEVWSRTYGDGVLYLGQGIAQTPDGGFVVCGWEAPDNWDERNILVARTDAAGNLEWWKTWNPGTRDSGTDLILSANGHIVVSCIESMGSGAPTASLLKLDLDGAEVWFKVIGDEGIGNTFWAMAELDDGYLMLGDTHVGRYGLRNYHAGLLVKTDQDGDLLWQRTFGRDQYEQVSLLGSAILADGTTVIVGSAGPDAAGAGDSLVLWFDDIAMW